MRTLLLTPWMAPHKIISWERAVVLLVLDKVDVLEEYDEEIRSLRWALRTPAVVRLKLRGRSAGSGSQRSQVRSPGGRARVPSATRRVATREPRGPDVARAF